ncbi:MAG TPA: hypothetical protein PK585_07780, partial [Amphiplicatus sp.]|nr:hypothetical protein [Amphiplicatus sp.]
AMAHSSVEDQVTWTEGHAPYCRNSVVWAERKAPSYPRRASQREYIGAVLIGYDLSETGVARKIILADAEQAGFGEAAAKSMDEWKLMHAVPPECRRNLLIIFTFTIKQT